MSIATETPVDESVGYGVVTVDGTDLPRYDSGVADTALGTTAPTVSGGDWNGNEYSVFADGRPKMLLFVAHHCGHCQVEVPEVQAWVDDGSLPDGVDLYAFTVGTDPIRPNWPPQDWLESEGWTIPTIMDDEVGSASNAYGLSAYPFWVVLDGANQALFRITGRVGTDGMDQLAQIALDSAG